MALPPESRLMRKHTTGGVVWGWDQELAATHIEVSHALLRVMAAGFGAKKGKLPKPLEIPRPHQVRTTRETKRVSKISDIMQTLGPLLSGGPSHE